MTDTLVIISLVLQALIIVILIFLLVRKKQDLREISLDDFKKQLSKELNEEVFNLASKLNKQLVENANQVGQTLGDFRVAVNKELVEFKGKLAENLQQEFTSLTESVDKKMGAINEKVEERLSKGFEATNETFGKIKESMAVMEQAQQKIEGLSNEMISLQDILSNNQQRGAFGEYQLEQILYATFGENSKLYAMQYEFKNPKREGKVRVDSVIFMPNGDICIDSKFPFSAYRKLFEEKLSAAEEEATIKALKVDVKKHIDDMADKYIVTGQTSDFAIMFLPSDGVLALLHSRLGDLIEYAHKKGVLIVSPTTIIPLIASYRIVRIDYERSKYAKEIGLQLNRLSQDFERFGQRWEKLANSIEKLSKESGEVSTTVGKITTKFSQLQTSRISEILDEKEKA
ncbi:DNA recombination protein RmuC [bacterium]|jgi:DNA recombination protein RmuC|nr:DNA recombination protein RmuC [bacterium]